MGETLGAMRDLISRRPASLWGTARLAAEGGGDGTLFLTGPRRVDLRPMIDVGPAGEFSLDSRGHLSARWRGPALTGLDDRSVELNPGRLQTGGEACRWTVDLDPSSLPQGGEWALLLRVGEQDVAERTFRVVVAETAEPGDERDAPTLAATLDPARCEDFIRLLVEEGEQGRLRVWGRCPGRGDFKDHVPRPSAVYVDTDQLDDAMSFLAGLRGWSNRSGPLVRWLREAMAGQPDPVVLIEDVVPSGEPFKLLFLDSRMESALGAAARVVRWNVVETIDRPLEFRLEHPPVQGRAEVVVEPTVDPMGAEKTAATGLQALRDQPLADLLDAWADAAQPPVLVHVASHAAWSVDEPHRRGLSTTDKDAELSELSFALLNPPLDQAAVFANACHSGRLALDDTCELTGLPLAFLQGHAWLFVGTMGRMAGKVASVVGARFLVAAGTPEGVDPAAFFRDLRREWLGELTVARRDSTEVFKKLQQYLHAGLYVVYGPARTRIKVEVGGG